MEGGLGGAECIDGRGRGVVDDSSKPTDAFRWIRAARDVQLPETLPLTRRLVLLTLATFADREGRCFPRIKTLARVTGLKARAVQAALRDLEAHGLIRTRPGRRKDSGRRGANVYTMTPTVDRGVHGDAPRS